MEKRLMSGGEIEIGLRRRLGGDGLGDGLIEKRYRLIRLALHGQTRAF